ncbi:MAG: hypothetical protein ABI858_05925 [Pseudoxanthomonas sp.]
MSMTLMLVSFLGAWLLLWAIVIGHALLKRLDGQRLDGERHSLTLLDDIRIEL